MKAMFFFVNTIVVVLMAAIAMWLSLFGPTILAIGCLGLGAIFIFYLMAFAGTFEKWLTEE